MRQTILNPFLWVAFAGLILTGAFVALTACDLGFRPLFGAASCSAPALNAALESERVKEVYLRSQIHAEEIRLALLPVCQTPLPPRARPQQVKTPDPVIIPKPPEEKTPVKAFEIPKKIEDLRGCWQSAGGDIDMTTDDAEEKQVGKARICFCFKSNGRGLVQVRYTDGDVCRADLFARISPDKVFMHHERASCRRHPYYVAADITCGVNATDQTNCEIQNLGKVGGKYTEQFIRVGEDYCGWNG